MFLIFVLSLLICLNFLKDQRSCLYNQFGGNGGLSYASFQPSVMTFGYINVIREENSWNWSRDNFQLKFFFLWIPENFLTWIVHSIAILWTYKLNWYGFQKLGCCLKVTTKSLTEFFGLISTLLIQMVKSSGMVFFSFGY